MPRVSLLLLGGTTEARELADRLRDRDVLTSLAGRTTDPLRPAGRLRVGGFGGAAGLAQWVRQAGVRAVVDATHPYAEQISRQAVEALAATPLLRLQRPGWTEQPGDRWTRVPTLEAAAALVDGRRVLLTTGRQGVVAFTGCTGVSRSVEAPARLPAGLEVLLGRGPFDVADEVALLRAHRIEVVVTKDSGGSGAKLEAARRLGLPVLLVDRPPAPAVPTVSTVTEAESWVRDRL